jgi:hypothetical protein
MDGASGLVCHGFQATEGFDKSRADLQTLLELSDREVEDRLEALEWALARDPATIADKIPGRNLWVAVTPEGIPPLRVFLRPRADVSNECEYLWIEERL